MSRIRKEREDLAKANVHIAEGERRVAQQIGLIQWMTKKGHDTEEATKLLWNYQTTLETWREHRRLILQEIARLEGRDPEAPVP
ncbi:hypothetical protein [Microvirga subterranea]|nr:hypothetical protein [Microvirga subterranea]